MGGNVLRQTMCKKGGGNLFETISENGPSCMLLLYDTFTDIVVKIVVSV